MNTNEYYHTDNALKNNENTIFVQHDKTDEYITNTYLYDELMPIFLSTERRTKN